MEKIRNYTQHNLPLKTKTNKINVQGGGRQDLRTPQTGSVSFAIILLP